MRSSRRPDRSVATALLFGAWTLFVWGGRLRNLLAEPGSVLDASRWSLVGSLAFTVLGVLVIAAALARSSDRFEGALRPSVAVLAVVTIGIWSFRAVDIAIGDHSLGFIVVHLVLAVVSIGLALLAVSGGRDHGAETTSGRLPSNRWVSL